MSCSNFSIKGSHYHSIPLSFLKVLLYLPNDEVMIPCTTAVVLYVLYAHFVDTRPSLPVIVHSLTPKAEPCSSFFERSRGGSASDSVRDACRQGRSCCSARRLEGPPQDAFHRKIRTSLHSTAIISIYLDMYRYTTTAATRWLLWHLTNILRILIVLSVMYCSAIRDGRAALSSAQVLKFCHS